MSQPEVIVDRVVLQDGAAHVVDSSELAFKAAAKGAFREAFHESNPVVLEPVMDLTVEVPAEFQGTVVGNLNRRKALIQDTEIRHDFCVISAHAPLGELFGYATDLRSQTQGKGEFSMEYLKHDACAAATQKDLVDRFNAASENNDS